jgi:hypothetical protein
MKSKKYLICDWCLLDGHVFVNGKAQSVKEHKSGSFHEICFRKYTRFMKEENLKSGVENDGGL